MAWWRPPSVPTLPGLDRPVLWIARRFLRGRGLEIGPLTNPTPLAPGARVVYLDRLDPVALRRHYPQLEAARIRDPDVIGDATDLPFFRDGAFDFLIASHLLEHLANPLAALIEWYRVLVPGGVLLLVVPDKRYTFDRDRERTLLGHLVWHLQEKRRTVERDHYLEWARIVEGRAGADLERRTGELEATGYAIHTHVWIDEDVDEILAYLARSHLAPFQVLQRLRGLELTYHLRKPGRGRRLPARLRVLVEKSIHVLRNEGPGPLARRVRAFLDRRQALHRRSGPESPGVAPVDSLVEPPRISVLTPVRDPVPRHLEEALESVRDQRHGAFEHVLVDDGSRSTAVRAILSRAAREPGRRLLRNERSLGIAAATQRSLEAATGRFVVLLDHDDRLHPDALAEVALRLADGASYVYTDHDLIDPHGRHVSPQRKPGWSPEFLLSAMYPGHLQAFERSRVLDLGGFRSGYDGSQDYDLALRYTEGPVDIRHVPRILYHWRQAPGSVSADPHAKPWARTSAMAAIGDALRRRGLAATVEPGLVPFSYRVRHALERLPPVTVLVDATEHPGSLPRLLVAAAASTPAPIEMLVVAGGSVALPPGPPDLPPTRLVALDPGEPASRGLNRAARQARGDVLLLMRGRVDLDRPGGLEPLLEQVMRPEAGIVGCRLAYPGGHLESAGLTFADDGTPVPGRWEIPSRREGIELYTLCVREVAAVPGVGTALRREVWDEVGGADDTGLTGLWRDADLCLKIGRTGRRILHEPHARLLHCETDRLPEVTRRDQTRRLRERWGASVTSDPHHPETLRRSWCPPEPGTGAPADG